MLSIKAGVRLEGLQPQMALAAIIANDVFRSLGFNCVITSGSDGQHKHNSLHYSGMALDLRTRHIQDDGQKRQVIAAVASALGGDFDVVLESDHAHLEYDPKRPQRQPAGLPLDT